MVGGRYPPPFGIKSDLSADYADSTDRQITLKALANSSPGFALKPWVKEGHVYFVATLKELRRGVRLDGRRHNLFRIASSKKVFAFSIGAICGICGLNLGGGTTHTQYRTPWIVSFLL